MVLSSCLAVYIPSVYSLSGYSRSHIQVYYAWYAAAYVGMRIGFGEEVSGQRRASGSEERVLCNVPCLGDYKVCYSG